MKVLQIDQYSMEEVRKPRFHTRFEDRFLSTVRDNRVNPLVAIAVAVVAILAPLAIGAIGSLGSGPDKACTDQWYSNLDLPPWMPPGFVFGLVWTILYISIGVASFILWFLHLKQGIEITIPMLFYVAQLLLNGLWTPVFFGNAQFKLSLAIIVVLLILVIITCVLFGRINIVAGLLFVPYIIWLCIAISLNVYIAFNNPDGIEANLKGPTTQTTFSVPVRQDFN